MISNRIKIISSLSFCLGFSLTMMTQSKQSTKPNIILILIDDQDMDEIETYGGKVYTPNIDVLAKEGIKFNNAYVSSTVCTPSRYSFLTGRYAGNSYSKLYKQKVGEKKQGLPSFNVAIENDKMNVAHVLSEAGYFTGFTGKYHLTSQLDQPEMYKGIVSHKKNKNVKPSPEVSAMFAKKESWGRDYLKHIGFDWAKNIYEGNLEKPYNIHNPEWTANAALEFLDNYHDKPFFLQITPTLLHGPDGEWVKSFNHPNYTGAGEIKAAPSVMENRIKLRKKLLELGYNPKSGDWGIAWIDAMIGQILNKLKTLNIDDNTLLIFAPDHGSSDKSSLYAINGTQIPLLMRWPKGIKAGIESDALVQNIDLAPTYFDLAKATIPKNYHLDGRSLTALFKNGKTTNWREHLYFELGNSRAVMTSQWKYIATRFTQKQIKRIQNAKVENLPKLMSPIQRLGIGVRGAKHSEFWDEDQLYNLQNDPNENINLAYHSEYQKDMVAMKDILKSYLINIGRPFGELYYAEDAALNGQIDDKIRIVKQLKIKGKKVIVPNIINNNTN